MIKPENDSAQIKYPPPLLMILVIFVTRAIHSFWPLNLQENGVNGRILGFLLISISLLLILKCAKQFKDAKTHIEPWKATSSIQKTGPYKYTRNPIYLGLVAMTLGFALIFNSFWVLIGAFVVFGFLNFYVIPKEESYLAQKFGESYLNYKVQIRRWI